MGAFDEARSKFVERLAAAPDESLTYLKPGDDYALGGLVHHVNAILEHYAGVLDVIVASRFALTDTADRPGLFEGANAKAKVGVTRAELSAGLAATSFTRLWWAGSTRSTNPTSSERPRFATRPGRTRFQPVPPTSWAG
jgi:hypothetical protein